ncbi:HAD-IIIA family hydrolase [Kribbella sp. CA-293567]|uniref:HAD-IIIA family hydrolase n=1 Tax=Kribbella sp. CA-293567 TaxID=3002436 RepID=UPI0022DD7C49|nr:HAD-IIIA family hydrolase [Kribbella sp. CA-293567]WBQ08305.1 HAD-IIIA family hydrolase [Kribbella sp. CA-293567]
MTSWSVVVPTVGRPALTELLADLAAQPHQPDVVFVVDDRRRPDEPLPVDVVVLRSGGRGPAAARNVGWRAAGTEWIVFLDDDVRLPADWSESLLADLRAAGPETAGVQGRIVVPLPAERAPTDWERSTAGLETAEWATADMAYRREALAQVDGFDERFPRAYREDAELALRVRRHGWRLVHGRHHVVHPVRDERFWVSLRVQRGNADDALFRAVHGRHWRREADCPPGRFRWHLATVMAAALTFTRFRRPAGLAWSLLTADFLRRRLSGGPGTTDEVLRMASTSVLIPFAAVWHRLRGTWMHRDSPVWPGPIRAVLFDRDGTLVHDVPYNGDADRVELVPGARPAVERLRTAGLQLGVVSNQSGIGRGLITAEQVAEVNQRVDDLLGPFSTWQVCPHDSTDGCACRKPAPGLVLAAAAELGVRPAQIVVIGDIGSDVAAAQAAGARSVLVPTQQTRHEEILNAPVTAPDLEAAVDQVLSQLPGGRR